LQCLPTDKTQSSVGTQGAVQIRKRRHRIFEEHHPEARVDKVKIPPLESVRLGIGVEKFQVREFTLIAALARTSEHGLRQVNAEHRAAGAYAFRQFKRCLSTAAADIEHTLSRLHVCPLHGDKSQLMDLRIQLLLTLDPSRSTLFIPVAKLFLIGCCAHR